MFTYSNDILIVYNVLTIKEISSEEGNQCRRATLSLSLQCKHQAHDVANKQVVLSINLLSDTVLVTYTYPNSSIIGRYVVL